MEELLTNTRPIIFGLIGFAILYHNYLNTKKQWGKKAPKQLTHPVIRIMLATLVFAIVAFGISAFLTTNFVYTLINTIVLMVLFLLYMSQVVMDVKKFHSKL